MSRKIKLRRYIVTMNYYIDKEIFIIENNKPYVIIKFKYGKKDYSDYDYILGINYDKDYLDYIKGKYINILNKIPDKYKDKINYYNNLISEIEKDTVKKYLFLCRKLLQNVIYGFNYIRYIL